MAYQYIFRQNKPFSILKPHSNLINCIDIQKKGSKDGSKFLDAIGRQMRMRGCSLKTEKAYSYWIKYFIRFHKLRHPRDMGANEVTDFLSYIANEQHLAIKNLTGYSL